MRDAQKWRIKLEGEIKTLQKSYGALPATLSPGRLLDIELVLTLFAEYLPNEDPALAWAILSGYDFPKFKELDERTQKAIILTRLRLPDLLGRSKWERDFEIYKTLGEASSLFPLYLIEDSKIIYRPTPIAPNRHQAMHEALTNAPEWKAVSQRYAKDEGIYRFYIDRIPYEVEIGRQIMALPQQVSQPKLSLNIPQQSGERIKVSLLELIETAKWMDKQLSRHPKFSQQHWEQRIRHLQLCLLQQTKGLVPSDKLDFKGLLNLIGMVGSGKSSLFTILTIYMARQGRRVTLVQGDVASLMRELELFEALRTSDPKILAVPMIGRSTRLIHLNRLYVLEAQNYGLNLIPRHPGFRYLSTVCPLDGLRLNAEGPIKNGNEPCNNLYLTNNQTEEDDEDNNKPDAEAPAKKFSCPIMPVCPTHTSTRSLYEATIWLATPASLLASKPQAPLVMEEARNIELVMRHSDLMLVDEADLVQVQFDNRFAPMEVLVGKKDSWLDKLANQVARQIYKPGRPLVGRNLSLDRWLTSHQNLQRAADRLYFWLRESKANREWLKISYFSGNRILQKVAAEIEEKGLPVTNFGIAQEAFNRDPLGSYPSNKYPEPPLEWVGAIRYELLAANSLAAHQELVSWLRQLAPKTTLKTEEWEFLAHHLLLALIISVLDHSLQDVIDLWSSAIEYLELDYGTGGLFYQPDDSLVKLVPEPGMGAVLGFQYHDPQNSGEGELRFFQIKGIGRALLYKLHEAYGLSNGDKGANVILASGSSFAPGSWRYHLQTSPDAILLPTREEEKGQVECYFEPLSDPFNPGQNLYVSGKSIQNERHRSLKAMVQELVKPTSITRLSRFETEFAQIKDENRRRILLVVGSYEEAQVVGEALVYELQQRGGNPEQVVTLIPDGDVELDMPAPRGKLYRSMLQQLAEKEARYLVAPLQAVERGHNILAGQVAAIGSIYFLTRPMPNPNDTQAAVQSLNAWSLNAASKLNGYNLGKAGKYIRQNAHKLWDETLVRQVTYNSLLEAERRALLWTQLVLVWQTIGRLLRGGVNARVHFIDAKWAPVSANLTEGELETWETSMLVGFKKILREAMNHQDPVHRAVVQALYGALANGLDQMKGIRDGR